LACRTGAVERWRRQFRGVAPQVKDLELTDAQIADVVKNWLSVL
jgi:hypothetical protein